jgi:hypothetical protein
MMNYGIFRSKGFVVGVVAAFLLLVTPVAEFAYDGPTPVGGTLTGRVLGVDGKTPVTNGTIKIRNLNTQKEYTAPTDANGMYKIEGVDEGWYTLALTTPGGDFSLNYGVYIKANATAKLSLTMSAGGVLEGKGSGTGGAGKSFFKTPGGIIAIVAIVVAAGFGVYELTRPHETVSPTGGTMRR